VIRFAPRHRDTSTSYTHDFHDSDSLTDWLTLPRELHYSLFTSRGYLFICLTRRKQSVKYYLMLSKTEIRMHWYEPIRPSGWLLPPYLRACGSCRIGHIEMHIMTWQTSALI